MDSGKFSSTEIEVLLRLSHGLERAGKTSLSATQLLESCNQLLGSQWAMLSSQRPGKGAKDRFAACAIQLVPAARAHIVAHLEKQVNRHLARQATRPNLPLSGQRQGIWRFEEARENGRNRSGSKTEGPALLAEWSVKPDGTRLFVSAHRSPESPAFTARDITTMMLIRLACRGAPPNAGVTLTPRLRQVLTALERGLTEKQCARELSISSHTVHVYVKSLHRKFMAHTRGQLLKFSIDPTVAARRQ